MLPRVVRVNTTLVLGLLQVDWRDGASGAAADYDCVPVCVEQIMTATV